MDNEQQGFCINAQRSPICVNPIFNEFEDEKDIITVILFYFQNYLPVVMSKKLDYYNKPIIVDPEDIHLRPQKDYGDYVAVLSITDDNSSYSDDSFYKENTEYVFQLELQVRAKESLEALENLIKFKSGVKTLLVNMDHNLGVNTEIDSFSYEQFGYDESLNVIRQGVYRFSVKDTRIKQ